MMKIEMFAAFLVHVPRTNENWTCIACRNRSDNYVNNARAINFTSDTAYPAARVKPKKSRKKITNNLAT